jgi:REP element-mobilizing transposase RayT
MGHSYFNLLVHVIFSTKDRRPTMPADRAGRIHEYLGGLVKEFGKSRRFGGTEDHIHGLISIRADVDVAYVMSRLKSLSSGWIHKEFKDMGDFAWQAGYGAFSVSQSNSDEVIAYIEAQVEHHRRRSFQDEFMDFLRRHEIEFDPEHVWD